MGSFSSQFIEIKDDDFRDLMESSDRMLKSATSGIRRYLYRQIDWRDRLICVKGSRGVGKTTLLLQHIREEFGLGSSAALYASLDDIWFAGRRLKDLASYLVSHGFTHLFLDEVHHLPDWSLQIKNVHDQFPELHVVYSGSSLLEIEKADGDLSRRQATYWLDALSFREFLGFEGILNHEAVPLGEILHNHRGISADIVAQVKILPLFERFLKEGAYPFYKDAFAGFHSRLLATVNKVLDVDWPKAEPVSRETILRTKRMLAVLSANAPQQPNMSVLWRELGTERNQGLKMLHALERAKLLLLLASKTPKLKELNTPEKIYCGDTNLMHAIAPRTEIGTVRETFFASQLRHCHHLLVPSAGDFLVDEELLVEVGGHGKTFRQIKDMPSSFIAADGIETGWGNKIPLWLFGFLY